MNKTIVVLSDTIKINKKTKKHAIDTFQQVMLISGSLKALGFYPEIIEFSMDLLKIEKKIKKANPLFIFNLVEDENLIMLAPVFLDTIEIKYTGCSSIIIQLTNNKIFFKDFFKKLSVEKKSFRIPEYINFSKSDNFNSKKKYIIKALNRHSSLGLTENSVKRFRNLNEISAAIKQCEKKFKTPFFAEEFINGREFNVSVLNGIVQPIAEMRFINYSGDKPKILCYDSKWNKNTFEYSNTVRSFDFSKNNKYLLKMIAGIATSCSDALSKLPYARIDFIVDKKDIPYILEINANPCLNNDSGFFASCKRNGYSYEDMIKEIINAIR